MPFCTRARISADGKLYTCLFAERGYDQAKVLAAHIRMAVVDILISKTFDASVICPAEQTCVIDDAIYDDVVWQKRE